MAGIARLGEAEPLIAPDASIIRELAGPSRRATAANQSLAEARLPPGGETAEHYHGKAEELYFFTSGSGRLRVGEVEREVRAGDCAAIPPGIRHKLWNTSTDAPLVLLCCSAPAYSDEDTFITEPSEPSA